MRIDGRTLLRIGVQPLVDIMRLSFQNAVKLWREFVDLIKEADKKNVGDFTKEGDRTKTSKDKKDDRKEPDWSRSNRRKKRNTQDGGRRFTI